MSPRRRRKLVQLEPARIEAARRELRGKCLDRCLAILGEDVLDDADLPVVVEREIEVRRRDEVDRRARTGRAADGDRDVRPRGGKQRERRRIRLAWTLLRVAEEAPRPLPRRQTAQGGLEQLVGDGV